MAETFLTFKPYAIALTGGILPSLVWLWFWLREDRAAPEPKGHIALSFAAGMAVVYFVLPVQKLISSALPIITQGIDTLAILWHIAAPTSQTVQMTLWAFVEEFGKLAAVFLVAYRTVDLDEPIDAVVYLITAALGFAAMENTFYILKDLVNGGGAEVVLNGNLRFIGATIVHTAASALMGLAFAFVFYGKFLFKIFAGVFGLCLATLLHAYFNLSIMEVQGTTNLLLEFSKYWLLVFLIIAMLEVVKHIKKPTY